ncbi:MAG: histidine kinase, partial [Bacteroidetes bacterium]|nr:histidine kinase [Bacteroidota bacterium]
YRLDPETGKTIRFSEEDGLSSNLVYLMHFSDNYNRLWIGTNQGLNKLKVDVFEETTEKIIEHYSKEEGFDGVECNSNGVYEEETGEIWFGTVNGLIRFDPSRYIPNETESKTDITGFRILYKDTLLSNHAMLEPNMNHISFDFIGVCLTNPSKVLYKHMLEGFEDQWSPETKTNQVTYSNLKPGDYTFKVASSNNEALWNVNPASFSFTIGTPFWQSWWFLLMTLTAIAGSGWSIFHSRIMALKRKIGINRSMDRIKLLALRAQMNPHFIFNSLNSIQHFINSNEKMQANVYLSKFAELMRMILDDSQRLHVTLGDELSKIKLFIELESLRFQNIFEYSIEIAEEIDEDETNIPAMIIQPYVENAIIHGLLNLPEKEDPNTVPGKLSISFELEDNFIICVVEDNGVGRENSKKLKERYPQKQHAPAGMKITQERLDMLNLTKDTHLSVTIEDLKENGKACGTRVIIRIPTLEEL